MNRTSIGGVTTGNSWLFNNPDLAYPEGHLSMDDDDLRLALKINYGDRDKEILKAIESFNKEQ